MKVLFKNGNMLRIEQNILIPETRIDPYNPADLPQYTLRIKLVEGKSPVPHYIDDPDADPGVWPRPTIPDPRWHQTCIDEENNIWDIKYENSNWSNMFSNSYQGYGLQSVTDLLEIESGNLAGVTNVASFLYRTSALKKACMRIPDLNGSYYSIMTGFLQGNTALEELKLDLSGMTSLSGSYWGNNVNPASGSVLEFKFTNLTNADSLLQQINSKKVIFHDCRNLTSAKALFRGCNQLESVVFDNDRLEYCTEMFRNCQAMHEMPIMNYSTIRYADDMFAGEYWDHPGEGLFEIRYESMPNVVNLNETFYQQTNVTGGALAMYNQFKDIQGISHSSTFANCGGQTPTGIAELVQIPSDWGGWQ